MAIGILLDGPDDQITVLAQYLQIGLKCCQSFFREFCVMAVATQLFKDGHLLPDHPFSFRNMCICHR